MDATSGQVLASINPHARLPIASTTKVMTALVALQVGQLGDLITVPAGAFNYESDATVMGLHAGQVVSLRDLLYGLLLPSGADAANAIAIHYGGSELGFVAMMNREAQLLGMRDTHYANAHGLTAQHHYSSAYDLAVLAQYVSYIPEFMHITGAHSYTWNGHVLTNLNHPLFWYSGVDGIKPGYTDDAGICQVLDARRGGRHVVVVLLHTPNLVTDARNLLNFGLHDYSWMSSHTPGDAGSLVLSATDRLGAYLYYPASGHYLRGKLLAAYLSGGGLNAFGFPRTEPLHVAGTTVQYFQNGALAVPDKGGSTRRLAIGLTPVPSAPRPTPTALPTSTPTNSTEGTITLPSNSARHPPTSTPTVTPTPHPVQMAPTVVPPLTNSRLSARYAEIAPQFAVFQLSHKGIIGDAVSAVRRVHGYTIQTFAYGALVGDGKHVWLLPQTDRWLSASGYLPDHPGNVYPSDFAPVPVLRSIQWLPATILALTRSSHGADVFHGALTAHRPY